MKKIAYILSLLALIFNILAVNAMAATSPYVDGNRYYANIRLVPEPDFDELAEYGRVTDLLENPDREPVYFIEVAYYCEECMKEYGVDTHYHARDDHYFSKDKEYLYTQRYIETDGCEHDFPADPDAFHKEPGHWELQMVKTMKEFKVPIAEYEDKNYYSGEISVTETEVKGYSSCNYRGVHRDDFTVKIDPLPERVDGDTTIEIPITMTLENAHFDAKVAVYGMIHFSQAVYLSDYQRDYSRLNSYADMVEQIGPSWFGAARDSQHEGLASHDATKSQTWTMKMAFPDLTQKARPESLYIPIKINCDCVNGTVLYVYQWVNPPVTGFPGTHEVIPRDWGTDSPGPVVKEVIDSRAKEEKGESGTSIPAAVAAIIFGGAAALAGVGAGGGSGDDRRKKKSSYKMCLRKDFGDAIEYDQPPVRIWARIVEIGPEGEEIDRPDLTGGLEIFSESVLDVSDIRLEGSYMGASVFAKRAVGAKNPERAAVSIRYRGEGGSLQNNVGFRLVGDPYISLAGPHLSVLAGSGGKFTLPVQFVDFANQPTDISFAGEGLSIGIEADENDNCYIYVSDEAEKPEKITSFYRAIPYTISAKDGDEVISADFTVLQCYEGILIDFLGKENEIMAYKNEAGEMPVTNIGFELGVWDEENQRLEQVAPPEVEISYTDKDGIYEIIGLSLAINRDLSTSDNTVYSFTAKKSLPAADKIKGTLSYAGKIGEQTVENEATIYLIPDLLVYAQDWQKEFENCEQIITTYLPPELRTKKIEELHRDKDKLGLEDLKLFRKHVWKLASLIIMQEKEDYLQEVYKYDEKIATAELLIQVGDIAFNAALAPYGGPVVGFLANNAKDTFLELFDEFIQKRGALDWETLENLLWGRFDSLRESLTDFYELGNKPSKKTIITWVSFIFIYQTFNHWYFDEDDEGKRLGLLRALEEAILDTFIKVSLEGIERKIEAFAPGEKLSNLYDEKAKKKAVENAVEAGWEVASEGLEEMTRSIYDYIRGLVAGTA